jgi:triacylglycerol lipase
MTAIRGRSFLVVLLCTLIAVFAGAGVTQGVPTEPVRPVLLVHGWWGAPEDFIGMRNGLQEAGYTVSAVKLLGNENRANAQAVREAVTAASAANGGSKVDIVGHSMGGLSVRHYLKFLDGTDLVANYVAMGTPQYGYPWACLLPQDGGGQMCPNSEFLEKLNAGDDTPGPVIYTTLHSTQDESDGNIDGGACFGTPIPGVAHRDEPSSPKFTAAVIEVLQGGCPGEFVSLPIT